MRYRNKERSKNKKKEALRKQAWEKAKVVRGLDPRFYRKDIYGDLIYRHSYGKTSNLGWECDHSHPKARGGTDSPRNIQALHWKNNRAKGKKYPWNPIKKKKRKLK